MPTKKELELNYGSTNKEFNKNQYHTERQFSCKLKKEAKISRVRKENKIIHINHINTISFCYCTYKVDKMIGRTSNQNRY